MSSTAPEENDLDSISSINSENEKVDSSLISKLLTHMKSEFNRTDSGDQEACTETEDAYENDSKSNINIKPEPEESTSEEQQQVEEPVHKQEDEIKSENIEAESNDIADSNAIVINKAVFVTQEAGDEQKPRLILTLRTNEESREMSSRFSRRSNVCHNSNETLNSSYSYSSDSSIVDKIESPDDKGSLWESRSRRSLRSSTRLTEKETDSVGMKRSSRRFSKEQGRESVLQNAIARKEKSFSSLNQEEKLGRRGARSPRQSPSDAARSNRPITRSKSPKVLNLDNTETEITPRQLCVGESVYSLSNSEVNFDLSSVSIKTEDASEDSNDTGNINSASTNSQTSEPSADQKPLQTNKLYTKTGKRRAKYFKGLKYSLTSCGSVKRRAINIAKKAKRQDQSRQRMAGNNGSAATAESSIGDHAKTYGTAEGLSRSEVFTGREESDYGNPIQIYKRKLELDTEESVDGVKRHREETVPSPLQGDAEAEPDKPESSGVASGGDGDSGALVHVGAAGLCLCDQPERIYAAPTGRPELYCQAVDSLDGRIVGCCNTVGAADALLSRPSVRVPFLVLCDVHHERLRRHNCCPGCGVFCTQGQFVQCVANHQYHEECFAADAEGRPACPHCGTNDACDVNISLGAHKYPVFFPLQKPSKKTPSAKMTFSYGSQEEPGEGEPEPPPPAPLVPPASLLLPSGLQVTSHGLPPGLDKDKLEELLHVACDIDVLSLPRFTLRNMYQAAKHGEAEKMVHMLASGLNPNHVFREWCMGSALHAASHGGHLAVVHLLVQAGAATDTLDRDQNTPLMLACDEGHNAVVKYLVKAGASVTFKGGDGMTALHLAAKAGNMEACHYLISNPNTPRSYIDAVDDGRWTPLVWAAEHKHLDVVKFLLEKRADPLVRDAEQNIALHWAALSGSIDISEALLNYGSDVNSTNAHADTPLHIAARQNAYECVLLLLARGARVDVHNRAGFLPLDCVPAEGDTYTAIKLNVELRNLALNCRKRSVKILSNDITKGHEANPVQCVNGVDDEPEPQDFTYVTENCFTSHISVDRTITSLQSCKCRDMCISGGCMCGKISIRCWYDDEGKLLPEFNFADPPLLFECNQACACNKLTCKNRVVQHGISARFQLFRARGNKGWGVSSLRMIPKGSYVCEYIGEIISDCEADTRENDCYLFDLDNRDGETYCIDARRYGNIARFINHSCEPNLLPVRVFIEHQDLHFPRIAFFANKDICPNEELGFDYGEKFWVIKRNLFTCTCGAEKCKYSEENIDKTLAAYNRKLKQEEGR